MITKVLINGMPGYCMENDAVSLTVLLQGAKVTSLLDKRTGKEWLWNRPESLPVKYSGDSFDCQWWGGMDDIFPNDIPSSDFGSLYSVDHGVMWKLEWKAVLIEKNKLVLEHRPGEGAVFLRKSILLEKDGFVFSYKIENHGEQEIDGLFRLHPAFSMESSLVLLVPGKSVVCDKTYHTPLCDNPVFTWPHMPVRGQVVDLSDLSKYESIAEILQYIELKEGFFKLLDRYTGSGISFIFDKKILPVLTLYALNNPNTGTRVIALEPSTGPYALLEQVRQAKQSLHILPGKCIVFNVGVNIY